MRYLRPNETEMRRFRLLETDPVTADKFDPISKGWLTAVLLLIYVAIAGAIVSPLRLFLRIVGRQQA